MKSLIGFLKVMLMLGGVVFYAGLGFVLIVGWGVGSAFNRISNDAAPAQMLTKSELTMKGLEFSDVKWKFTDTSGYSWSLAVKLPVRNTDSTLALMQGEIVMFDKEGFKVGGSSFMVTVDPLDSAIYTEVIAMSADNARRVVSMKTEILSTKRL